MHKSEICMHEICMPRFCHACNLLYGKYAQTGKTPFNEQPQGDTRSEQAYIYVSGKPYE